MNTKKFFIVSVIIVTIGCSWTHAQVMEKGMSLFNAGLGMVPGIGIHASYDYGLIDHWGPGIFTIGGYAGLGFWNRTHYEHKYSNYRTNAFAFAPRATYRYTIEPPFEIYGSIMLGAVVKSFSHYYPSESRAFLGITAGARYLFKRHYSLFAEIGYNEISFLNVGLCYSF